ncbi:MAG: PrpF domain-containing protein, partial [Casimicrobium sp.]
EHVNSDPAKLAMFEKIRTAGALKMGLIKSADEALKRQHTPKIAFVAPAQTYTASSGKSVNAKDVDVCVRALSMGKLHHAMMGTASVAIAVAACIPGTVVNAAAGGGARKEVRFGHPSGATLVGAEASIVNGEWQVKKAVMSRSARVLMSGHVHIPSNL